MISAPTDTRLSQRLPEEWLRLIKRISVPDLRNQVAAIVWWQYFSARKCKDRWDHLDIYLQSYRRRSIVSFKSFRRALRNLGFSYTVTNRIIRGYRRSVKDMPKLALVLKRAEMNDDDDSNNIMI